MAHRHIPVLAISCSLLFVVTLPAFLLPDALPTQIQPQAMVVDAWTIEIVDNQGDVGLYSSLALDGDGSPHISYYDQTHQDLKYAAKDAAGWHVETVDTSGSVGKYSSLALDDAGRPHIGYYDETYDDLQYAYRDDTGWHVEIADRFTGAWSSLELDANGQPHIASTAGYTNRDATGWHTETMGKSGSGISLALDEAGQPHVTLSWSYWCPIAIFRCVRVEYGYRDASGWQWTVIGSWRQELDRNATTSLVLDGLDNPHVAVGWTAGRAIGYLTQDDSGWHGAPGGLDGFDPSLAIDQSHRAHIGFKGSSDTGHSLQFARLDDETWTTDTVDPARAEQPSLALAANGAILISYYANGQLRLASVAAGPPTPTPTATPEPATPWPTPSVWPSSCPVTPTPLPAPAETPAATGTVRAQVRHCMDDSYVRVDTGEPLFASTWVRTGTHSGGYYTEYQAGFLFRDMRIPQGSEITSARLRLEPGGWQSGTPVEVDLRGELRPQAEDFSPANLGIQVRPRTQASVPWTIATIVSGTVDSPDLSAVVKEIVQQAAWRPGNNLAIFVDARSHNYRYVDWRAYDAFPTQAAQLIVSYEWSGQPPPSSTPTSTASPTQTQTPTRSPTLSATPSTTASPTASTTPTATPSNTPTPSPTPSATATPASRRVYLPMIVR